MSPQHVVSSFIEFINQKDLDGLLELLTDDHCMIMDKTIKVIGKENARRAWEDIFEIIPDLMIEINQWFIKDESLEMICTAQGSVYNEGYPVPVILPRIPTSHIVTLDGQKIALWKAFWHHNVSQENKNSQKSEHETKQLPKRESFVSLCYAHPNVI